MQTDLFSLEKQADRAIYVAGAFADPEWKREANAAIQLLCNIGNDFTGDDVWRLLAQTEHRTDEPRALGALIRQFVKEGLIYATGEYRKSIRKESHRRPLAVWRPLQYKRHTLEVDAL